MTEKRHQITRVLRGMSPLRPLEEAKTLVKHEGIRKITLITPNTPHPSAKKPVQEMSSQTFPLKNAFGARPRAAGDPKNKTLGGPKSSALRALGALAPPSRQVSAIKGPQEGPKLDLKSCSRGVHIACLTWDGLLPLPGQAPEGKIFKKPLVFLGFLDRHHQKDNSQKVPKKTPK